MQLSIFKSRIGLFGILKPFVYLRESLENLPGSCIGITSWIPFSEILLDDSRLFAGQAQETGVDVTLQGWEGMVQHFPLPASKKTAPSLCCSKTGVV